MMPVATVMPDDTPMFDPSILHELDWSENTTTFSPAISPLEPGDGLVMRPLCTADVNRGFFKVLGQLTETGVVSPEQFIKTFEHMKRSGDYYVTVVEDTNLGQIVATATLVIEHKFTHSCAKGKERFDACPVLPPSELFSRSGRVLVEQMAADLAAGESQLGVNRELKRYKSLSRGEVVVGPLHLLGAGRGVVNASPAGGIVSKQAEMQARSREATHQCAARLTLLCVFTERKDRRRSSKRGVQRKAAW